MSNILHLDIESETLENECLRQIVYTDSHLQLILQSIPPEKDIPYEIHDDSTQFIRCESGLGTVFMLLNGKYEEFGL